MSIDHKPNNEGEQRRIEAAGGVVHMKRVDGDLAVSRAIGDFTYKQNKALSPGMYTHIVIYSDIVQYIYYTYVIVYACILSYSIYIYTHLVGAHSSIYSYTV